jgi:predicted transcriptional regulator
MTMTIKLAPEMEQQLRRRSAALGLPASALIREALALYLEAKAPAETSAYALGAGVFGRHRGPADLAEQRRKLVADAWSEKHASRRG